MRFRGQDITRDAIDTISGQLRSRASWDKLTNIDSDPSNRWQRHHQVCYSRRPWWGKLAGWRPRESNVEVTIQYKVYNEKQERYGFKVNILTSDVVREICIKLEKRWCRNGRSNRNGEWLRATNPVRTRGAQWILAGSSYQKAPKGCRCSWRRVALRSAPNIALHIGMYI